MTKSFEQFSGEHFGGTGNYYQDGLLKAKYTDGVKDFQEEYGAGWLITDLLLQPKVRQARDMVYPTLVVKDNVAHVFLDCDKATVGKDKPLFQTKDLLKVLPEGKLNFVFNPFSQILCLMSED